MRFRLLPVVLAAVIGASMLGVWGGHAGATQWCPSGTTFQGPLGCVDNDDQPSEQPTTQDTPPTVTTPRGCRIVVTVSENRPGHGSTNCLTSDGIAAHEDTINNGKPEDEWLDVDSLPPCPLSTAPADLEALDLDSSGRKRCVATN